MHARLVNLARLVVEIRPRTPLLIRSGGVDVDPGTPEIAWIRAPHPVSGSVVYLPGTSLKGVFRSHAERIFRTFGHRVCDVFEPASPCMRARAGDDGAARHAALCAVCRMFGSTSVRGRVSLADAYPWPVGSDAVAQEAGARACRTEARTQVGIDRRTAKVKGGALFRVELVTGGAFETELRLRNFELRQLGLVGILLRHLADGLLTVGGSSSRGTAQVDVSVRSAEIHTVGSMRGVIAGAGALSGQRAAAFGLAECDEIAVPPGGVVSATWRGQTVRFDAASSGVLLDTAIRQSARPWLEKSGKVAHA